MPKMTDFCTWVHRSAPPEASFARSAEADSDAALCRLMVALALNTSASAHMARELKVETYGLDNDQTGVAVGPVQKYG